MIVQIVNIFTSYEGCTLQEHDAFWVCDDTSCKDTLYPTKKELYRMPDDDGQGSGPVCIETVVSHYTMESIKIMAREHEYSNWDYQIYLNHNPYFIFETTVFPDYYPSPNLPQNVPWRIGYLVSDFTSPPDFFKDYGINGSISGKVCHTVWACHWYTSDHYHKYQISSTYRFQYGGRYYTAYTESYRTSNSSFNEFELHESWQYFFNNELLNSNAFNTSMRYWYVIRMAPNGTSYRCKAGDLTLTGTPVAELPYRNEYSYWFNHALGLSANTDFIDTSLFSECFYDAFKAFPEVQQNTIANVIEIISLIKGFLTKPYLQISDMKSTAKEAWLAYRYSYSTTRSDIEELAQLSQRLLDLGEKVKCYGQRYCNGIAYHCEIVVDSSQFIPKEMHSLCEKLSHYGAELSLYNIWDMVPYSFVCDWFLDVGSMLESIDSWLNVSHFHIDEVWYSAISTYPMGTKVYFRWQGRCPTLPSFTPHISKNKTTWLKRAADLISIL